VKKKTKKPLKEGEAQGVQSEKLKLFGYAGGTEPVTALPLQERISRKRGKSEVNVIGFQG
jgi:hypothetical protein